MNLTEKVAYLKGLAEGLEIGEDKKQGKVLMGILDLLEDMALEIGGMQDDMEELCGQVDEIDEDLGEVEAYLSGEDLDDECDCEDCDDEEEEYYEVECPKCGETIYVDEDLLDEDYIVCPNCNEEIEVELEDECDCQCDCDECKE
ncbi:MAG: CD1247 N-terminal domain-containing protein [Eubacteriales bacterium]